MKKYNMVKVHSSCFLQFRPYYYLFVQQGTSKCAGYLAEENYMLSHDLITAVLPNLIWPQNPFALKKIVMEPIIKLLYMMLTN
jgi:hypothetical protein